MGCATDICSDKTGTLTMNQMTVVDTWFGGGDSEAAEREYASLACDDFQHILRHSIVLNTTALRQDGKVVGYPTEMALIDFVRPVDE